MLRKPSKKSLIQQLSILRRSIGDLAEIIAEKETRIQQLEGILCPHGQHGWMCTRREPIYWDMGVINSYDYTYICSRCGKEMVTSDWLTDTPDEQTICRLNGTCPAHDSTTCQLWEKTECWFKCYCQNSPPGSNVDGYGADQQLLEKGHLWVVM